MTISSRTPEGEWNVCPCCGAEVNVEPSLFTGDAPCPNCGTLLWFFNLPDRTLFFSKEESFNEEERLKRILAKSLNVSEWEMEEPGALELLINDLKADSNELAEFVMELEKEFDAGEWE